VAAVMGFLVRCGLEVKAKSNNCCNVSSGGREGDLFETMDSPG